MTLVYCGQCGAIYKAEFVAAPMLGDKACAGRVCQACKDCMTYGVIRLDELIKEVKND